MRVPGHKELAAHPYLEYRLPDGERANRVLLEDFPFWIGRGAEAHFIIHSREISKLHAEIFIRDGDYLVRDLDSRNGTFVNGDPVKGERVIKPDDVLHIATKELRFGIGAEAESAEATLLSDPGLQLLLVRGVRDLASIMSQRGVRAVFQAVVSMTTREVVGYEALSRINMPELDYSLADVFKIAGEQKVTAKLSRLMREVALESVRKLPPAGSRVFFNVHPSELGGDELFDSLAAIPQTLGPGIKGVIEFPETVVADLGAVRTFRSKLQELGLGLAYDDFGAGQSRLMELAEVPPDIIKLDISLIHGIHQSASRQELVAALIQVMRDLGVEVLAEGIECEEEWQACQELGCSLAQGFLTHRPAPVDDIAQGG